MVIAITLRRDRTVSPSSVVTVRPRNSTSRVAAIDTRLSPGHKRARPEITLKCPVGLFHAREDPAFQLSARHA